MTCVELPIDRLHELFDAAAETWRGCTWPTEFGSARLNLQGMTAFQARLLAGATCGTERKAWKEAAEWLERVEMDACRAQQEARFAVDLACRGNLAEARTHIQRAVNMETIYRFPSVWVPLRDAILTASRRDY